MKYLQGALAILAVLCASIALADDFKTVNGKEYKNAKINRVEPDGIVISFSGGIVKIPFTDLSKELQQKYNYDPETAKKFSTETAETQRDLYLQMQEMKAQVAAQQESQAVEAETRKNIEQADKLLSSLIIYAVIRPFYFGEESTDAYIQAYRYVDTGLKHNNVGVNWAPWYEWEKDGDQFVGTIDEPMPQSLEKGDGAIVALYKIGHTEDGARNPRFTTNREKALKFLLTGSTK